MDQILDESPLIETDFEREYKILKKKKKLCAKVGYCEFGDKRPKPKGEGRISFRNVRFSYPSRPDVEVIRGLSFDINQGEHVAIVGSSGSGKSTITALILRFYDPISGEVIFLLLLRFIKDKRANYKKYSFYKNYF